MSNTTKIQSLIQLTQYISLFIILIGLFLGSMYAYDANLFISIPVSFGLVILLYYFIDIMIAAKMDRKRDGVKIGIKMLWALFIVVAIPVNMLILHSLNVEISEKAEIQQAANEKIKALRQLKQEYTSKYETYLRDRKTTLRDDIYQYGEGLLPIGDVASKNKVSHEFIESIDHSSLMAAENAIETALISFERKKFLRQDTVIFGNTNVYLAQKEQIINGWERFAINNALNDLDKHIPETFTKLNSFLNDNAQKTLTYNKTVAEKTTLINQPVQLILKHLGFTSLIFILITNLLLLTPYLIAPSIGYGNPKKPISENVTQY